VSERSLQEASARAVELAVEAGAEHAEAYAQDERDVEAILGLLIRI